MSSSGEGVLLLLALAQADPGAVVTASTATPAGAATVVAWIGAATGLVGALLGYLTARYNARLKLRELQVTYEQKLHEGYLSNARKYTEALYVPLALAMANLRSAFDTFRRGDATDDTSDQNFRACIDAFLDDVRGLMARGAAAFLTTALELRLGAFVDFLAASRSASTPIVRAVIAYDLGLGTVRARNTYTRELRGRAARLWASDRLALATLGLSLSYEASELLAAPIRTPEFEKHVHRELADINVLVKEVTLGAQKSPELMR